MIYLVDANVLSEATRAAPSAKVVNWLRDKTSLSLRLIPSSWARSAIGQIDLLVQVR